MTLGLSNGIVSLADYDPRWAVCFADEAERLRLALGSSLPLAIEHIGSTAVPGLIAKPILDVLCGFPADALAARYIEPLVRAGYVHRGPNGIPGREYFVRGDPRAYHLHLVAQHGPLWGEHLAFRDALRQSDAVRAEYATLKAGLAARLSHDRAAYTDGKAAFIQRVVRDQRRPQG